MSSGEIGGPAPARPTVQCQGRCSLPAASPPPRIPVGPCATHFGVGLSVVLATLGDFQSERTHLLPVSYPAEPGWGRSGGDGMALPECRLTWPGDRATEGSCQARQVPGHRPGGGAQTVHKATMASLCESDGHKEKFILSSSGNYREPPCPHCLIQEMYPGTHPDAGRLQFQSCGEEGCSGRPGKGVGAGWADEKPWPGGWGEAVTLSLGSQDARPRGQRAQWSRRVWSVGWGSLQ